MRSLPSSRLAWPAAATIGSTIALMGFRVRCDFKLAGRVGHDDVDDVDDVDDE